MEEQIDLTVSWLVEWNTDMLILMRPKQKEAHSPPPSTPSHPSEEEAWFSPLNHEQHPTVTLQPVQPLPKVPIAPNKIINLSSDSDHPIEQSPSPKDLTSPPTKNQSSGKAQKWKNFFRTYPPGPYKKKGPRPHGFSFNPTGSNHYPPWPGFEKPKKVFTSHTPPTKTTTKPDPAAFNDEFKPIPKFIKPSSKPQRPVAEDSLEDNKELLNDNYYLCEETEHNLNT